MNAKEEKILGLLEEKKKLFELDDVTNVIKKSPNTTFVILGDLCQKKKISQIMYDECLFWASEKTMLAFEKKKGELESEFGID